MCLFAVPAARRRRVVVAGRRLQRQHSHHGTLADLRADGSNNAAADDRIPGDVQEILLEQTQRSQTALATQSWALPATCSVQTSCEFQLFVMGGLE
jgi:hypothetical protein